MQSGEYRLLGFGLSTKFEDDMIAIEKWDPEKPLTAVYFDGEKKVYMIKRFLAERSNKPVHFIPEGDKYNLELPSTDWKPMVKVTFRKLRGETEVRTEEINVDEFISIKGLKAKGNVLTKETVTAIDPLTPIPYEPPVKEEVVEEQEPEIDAERKPIEIAPEVVTSSKKQPEPKTASPKKSSAGNEENPEDDEGQLGLF